MQLPLQISYRDVEPSPSLAEHIQRRADKLDHYHSRITSCRVAIESPKRHNFHGKRYHVRIDLTVPRSELVVGRHPGPIGDAHADCHIAIDEAFDEAERLLQDHARRRRGEVKRHDGTPHARVSKLFKERGYGFLEHEGEEIYFHEHSVLHGRFHQLEIGMEVRYAEEDGDKGPQASTVDMVHPLRRVHEAAKREAERESLF